MHACGADESFKSCTQFSSARLVTAPTVFRDGQSSFGLWAVMANYGIVHAVPMLKFTQTHSCATTTPDLGADWVWSTAPVLYPHEAERLNFTKMDRDAMLLWLESN